MFSNKQKTRMMNVLIGHGAWHKRNKFVAPTNSDELDIIINRIIRSVNELDKFDAAIKELNKHIVRLPESDDDDDDSLADANNHMITASNTVSEMINIKELMVTEMYSALGNHISDLRNSDYSNKTYIKFEEIMNARLWNNNLPIAKKLQYITNKWSQRYRLR